MRSDRGSVIRQGRLLDKGGTKKKKLKKKPSIPVGEQGGYIGIKFFIYLPSPIVVDRANMLSARGANFAI
jgi:hypothetical protein